MIKILEPSEILVLIRYAQKPHLNAHADLTLNLIETPFNTFANRADRDQTALVRAA